MTMGVKGAMTMEVIGLGITAIALGMGVALGAGFILGVGLYTVGLWKEIKARRMELGMDTNEGKKTHGGE